MPVLVLNGAMGIPQDQTLAGVDRVAADVSADIVPASRHAIGEDNPDWVADRLARFFRTGGEDHR